MRHTPHLGAGVPPGSPSGLETLRPPALRNLGPFFLARTSILRLEPSQARSYVRQRPAGGAPSIVNLTVASATASNGERAQIRYETRFIDIFDQIIAYAAGQPIHVVNPEVLAATHASGRGNNSDFRGVAVVAMMSRRQARSLTGSDRLRPTGPTCYDRRRHLGGSHMFGMRRRKFVRLLGG